jgi:hypothetical protein
MLCSICMWGLTRTRRAGAKSAITMHRWTAKSWTAGFLLLVMLVPAFGPLARAAQPEAMHCMRKPLSEAPAVQPAMHCHHGVAQNGTAKPPQPVSPQASFNALDCCWNHDCCRSLKTSEWARPASNLLSLISLLVEPAVPLQAADRVSAELLGQDSARAPPLR